MSIYDEIADERQRAHEIHGPKSIESWPPTSYPRLAILLEEVGEVAREFNEAELEGRDVDAARLRAELIQTAACAAAWADALTVPAVITALDSEPTIARGRHRG